MTTKMSPDIVKYPMGSKTEGKISTSLLENSALQKSLEWKKGRKKGKKQGFHPVRQLLLVFISFFHGPDLRAQSPVSYTQSDREAPNRLQAWEV